MQNKYILERINHEGYKRYLVYYSHESFVGCLPEIQAFVAKSFRNDGYQDSAKVLIDLVGVIKGDDDRFLDCRFHGGKLYFENFVKPSEYFVKKTEEILKEHPECRDVE